MQSANPSTLPAFLDRELLSRALSLADHLAAAEAAFRAHAEGRTRLPLPLHVEADGGGLHAKGAYIALDRQWVAVKVNSNFPGNPAIGLPTIQGAVLLFDASDGRLLAILDSMEITSKRTAAASALAARHLALEDADIIAILGCGEQGRAQLRAITAARRLRRATCWDIDPAKASGFAQEMRDALRIEVTPSPSAREASAQAGIVVTATSATRPFLGMEELSPGTFVAAVGADSPRKNELRADLFRGATVVVDSRAQAATMGDLHHAIGAGTAAAETVAAELGEIVAGQKPGRRSREEIIVFDSTGLAIQDVAAAAMAYERVAGVR